MTPAIFHPMQMPMKFDSRSKLHRILIPQSIQGMGFSWDPIGDITDFAQGLGEAIGQALNTIVQVVGQIIEVILKVITDVLNIIAWDKVFENLALVVREASNIAVQLNPTRLVYNFLAENPLTSHTFKELDKFTGGMITNLNNVSDLMYRAARGDAISKQELIKDAMFGLQVAALVVGGPAAAGGLVGNMIGKEVCKKAGDAKDACQIAVTVAAAATANYAADVYGVNWGLNTGTEQLTDTSGQTVSTGTTDTLVQAQQNNLNALFAESGTLNFSDYLSTTAYNVLQQRGVQEVSKRAIELCQQGQWVGDRECAILGQIAANYVNRPDGMDWPEFLAQEAARLGVSLLMEQWFPPNSPERRAIEVVNNTVPGQTIIYETKPKSSNGMLVLLAGGAAALLMIGGS